MNLYGMLFFKEKEKNEAVLYYKTFLSELRRKWIIQKIILFNLRRNRCGENGSVNFYIIKGIVKVLEYQKDISMCSTNPWPATHVRYPNPSGFRFA